MTYIILSISLLVLTSIIAVTLAEPPSRTASANCSSCHSSGYYMRVTVQSVDAAPTIAEGGSGDVNVSVQVTGSDKRSAYTGFRITVSLSSQSGKVGVPASQSLSSQILSGTSAPYTWSKMFNFKVTGKTAGDDTVTATATMDPNHESPAVSDRGTATTTVISTNSPPVLSLPALDPASGDTKTAFSYNVRYSDPDNDPPSYVRLFIDGVDQRTLSPMPGQGTDYISGVAFGISDVTLAEGVHTYSFQTTDGKASVDLPVGGRFDGPDVVRSNGPPSLTEGSVSPFSALPTDEFSFHVRYTDPDGTPPDGGVRLYIDGSTTHENMEIDQAAPASLRDGDFENGERYVFRTVLGIGNHSYLFNATDGRYFAQIGPFDGPVVSSAPVLISEIIAPKEGDVFYSDQEIRLVGAFSSNKEVTDATYTWTSDVSGWIASGPNRTAILELGEHRITLNVTSADLSLTSFSSVRITVLQPVPPIVVEGFDPASDQRIEETKSVDFAVLLKVNRPVDHTITWRLDREAIASDVTSWTFSTGHNDSGTHTVSVQVISKGELLFSHLWKVYVEDVPAGILVTGSIATDLGTFREGDILFIALPLKDELGRELQVEWYVDGLDLNEAGLMVELLLQERQWAEEGSHQVTAMVRNPDGSSKELTFTYFLEVLPSSDDDTVEDETGGSEKGLDLGLGPLSREWMGYLIVVLGLAGVISGSGYGAYTLFKAERRPVVMGIVKERVHTNPAPLKDEGGFESWD